MKARLARDAKPQLADGVAAFNHLFTSYVAGARRRQRAWGLSKEEFRRLTGQPCYYCGELAKNPYRTTNGCKGAYLFNGLDRVDNCQGYVESNCVPCCAVCNRMKGTIDVSVFLERARRIAETHGLIAT